MPTCSRQTLVKDHAFLVRPAYYLKSLYGCLLYTSKPAVFAHVESLVGGVYDDGIIREMMLIEISQESAYTPVSYTHLCLLWLQSPDETRHHLCLLCGYCHGGSAMPLLQPLAQV